MANFFTKSIQFFYCKYEAHFVSVNIISSKFFLYHNHLRISKLSNLTERSQCLILHLLNYISSLITKRLGKMKQDLALFFSCCMTVSPLTLSWHFWGELFVKSKYYFSSSWCFLSIVTPWFVSNADNTNIWISTFSKRIFWGF